MPRKPTPPKPEPNENFDSAPNIIPDAQFDFTPRRNNQPAPMPAPDRALPMLSELPQSINIQYPDIQGMMPTDWFQPSSSSVPQTDNATHRAEMKVVHQQANSIELLKANLTNVKELVSAGVIATEIGKQMAHYVIGLEEIRELGVQLANRRITTQNTQKQGLILMERGVALDRKLDGERLKTQNEGLKNKALQQEIDFRHQLIPIKEREWNLKLEQAQSQAEALLHKYELARV